MGRYELAIASLKKVEGHYTGCYDEYLRDVASAWGLKASHDRMTPIWEATAACLRDRGAIVPAGPQWEDLVTAAETVGGSSALQACTAKAQGE